MVFTVHHWYHFSRLFGNRVPIRTFWSYTSHHWPHDVACRFSFWPYLLKLFAPSQRFGSHYGPQPTSRSRCWWTCNTFWVQRLIEMSMWDMLSKNDGTCAFQMYICVCCSTIYCKYFKWFDVFATMCAEGYSVTPCWSPTRKSSSKANWLFGWWAMDATWQWTMGNFHLWILCLARPCWLEK